jgi:hypothetical protein
MLSSSSNLFPRRNRAVRSSGAYCECANLCEEPSMYRKLSFTTAILISTSVTSCTGGRGENGTNCTVTQEGSSTQLECDDGTSTTIKNGATGATGKNGTDGENGADGFDGTDGATSLIIVTDEPSGTHCPNGGTLVTTGLDDDKNGSLSATEVLSTRYICNGAPGTNGRTSLVLSTIEPIGNHCVDGGLRIDTGTDANGNSLLDSLEITQTQYLCKTQCTVVERTVTVPAIAHTSLDYTGTQTYTANVIVAENTSTTDVVGWLGFDLTNIPSNSVVLGTKLNVRHNPTVDTDTTDNPTIQVLLSAANRFTNSPVNTTNLPKGSAVSATITSIISDGWTSIPLSLVKETLAADRSDGYMTLGLDEVTGDSGNHLVAFFGTTDAITRPYLEFSLVSCD